MFGSVVGDENVFGWISENIFRKNENRKQPENENKKSIYHKFSLFLFHENRK